MTIKPILLIFLFFFNDSIAKPSQELPNKGTGPWIVNAYYQDIKQLQNYSKTQTPWSVNTIDKYFTVSVDTISQYKELIKHGFNVEINQKHTESSQRINQAVRKAQLDNKPLDVRSIPGFACYRTVEETFSTMDQLATQYPNLASIVPIGSTWNKIDSGGSAGYDMKVIKITNSAITGEKPILFATSSIHARELSPAELNTRFAEYLLNNYGTDADATWLVDNREIHLLLQGNPDGRKIAETGQSKRKNENNTYCSNQFRKGVDMNRNFEWMWNQGSGSSNSTCDQTFRGGTNNATVHSYEPENQAINNHLLSLFADQRGEGLLDAAPDDATGVYIDIHSFSELVLFPYGYDSPGAIPLAPNHFQLQTLARKFAWYNNYDPKESNQLYGADGASDDNAYGQLGIASFTFELGTAFFQDCPYFEGNIYPNNLQALIYAAKVADTPYITASGPDIENISFSAPNLAAGTPLTVNGLATDTHFNNSNTNTSPAETFHNIASVELYVDETPWSNGATSIIMSATDGNFNSTSELFTHVINTTGMNTGQHIVYIQATDANGVTGVPYAQFFNIVDPAELGTLSGIVRDTSTNLPLNNVQLIFNQQQVSTDLQGQYQFSSLAGNYDLTINKQGYLGQVQNNVSVTAQQTTTQNISLAPVCAWLDENTNSFNTIVDAENAGWTHNAVQGQDDWKIDTNTGVLASHAFSTHDAGVTTDKSLTSPAVSITANSTLEFMHKYSFEGSTTHYDGAVIEISANNGPWQSLEQHITIGGYNGPLSNGNPINGNGWGGQQTEFNKVTVNLGSFAGSSIKIRWRFGADSSVSAGDWVIDNIQVLDPNACINDVLFMNSFE